MSSCPLSFFTIDEKAARLSSVGVLVILSAALIYHSGWIALAGMIDFILKNINPKLSPLSRLSKMVIDFAGLTPTPVNAGPKLFAAKIGAVMMGGIALALFLHWEETSTLLGAILALCAFLEAAFGFCVGCKMYGWVLALKPNTPPDYTI